MNIVKYYNEKHKDVYDKKRSERVFKREIQYKSTL